MIQAIKGQPIASTHLDLQGEQMSLEDLHCLLASMPPTVLLHQHHNLSLPVCGRRTNFRIAPHPDEPQHSLIVCDVEFDDEKIDGLAPGGFSFSALVGGESLSENPDCGLYLPFPLYQDQELIQRLLKSYPKIAVGK